MRCGTDGAAAWPCVRPARKAAPAPCFAEGTKTPIFSESEEAEARAKEGAAANRPAAMPACFRKRRRWVSDTGVEVFTADTGQDERGEKPKGSVDHAQFREGKVPTIAMMKFTHWKGWMLLTGWLPPVFVMARLFSASSAVAA